MRTAKAMLQDSAGMTVVEVIIALGIVTVGLLALIAAMPLSTSQIGEASLKTTATFLAQQRLEQIKNAQWTTAPPDTLGGAGLSGNAAVVVAGFPDRWPDEDYNTIVIPMGGNNASYPRFRRQVRIADCSVTACSGIPTATPAINTLRQVTVTVFFRPLAGTGLGQGTEETVSFVTLIAKR
jgi:type II secretory pathway pseudopilin PulG